MQTEETTKDNGFNVNQVFWQSILFSPTFFLGSPASTGPPTQDSQESIYRHSNHKLFSPCKKDLSWSPVMHKHEAGKYCHIFMYWYKGCEETSASESRPFHFWQLACSSTCHIYRRLARRELDANVFIFSPNLEGAGSTKLNPLILNYVNSLDSIYISEFKFICHNFTEKIILEPFQNNPEIKNLTLICWGLQNATLSCLHFITSLKNLKRVK